MARVGGRKKPGDLEPGEVFARRMVELRKRHGWTQQRLAERLNELGAGISRQTLAKLERYEKDPRPARNLTLSRALAIAYALDVSPLHMFTPVESGPRVIVSGGVQPADPHDVRAWVRGEAPLLAQDARFYFYERPPEEVAEILEDAQKVAIGRPTSHEAFFVRQALVAEGKAPPIGDAGEEDDDG